MSLKFLKERRLNVTLTAAETTLRNQNKKINLKLSSDKPEIKGAIP